MMKCALVGLVSWAGGVLKSLWGCMGYKETVGTWLLSHLLPQGLLQRQAFFVGIIGGWGCANLTLTMWAG